MPKTSIALAITVAACVGMWAYMLRVANPNIRLQAVITGDRAGDLGDLYPRWHGTRQLILFGPEPPWPRCELWGRTTPLSSCVTLATGRFTLSNCSFLSPYRARILSSPLRDTLTSIVCGVRQAEITNERNGCPDVAVHRCAADPILDELSLALIGNASGQVFGAEGSRRQTGSYRSARQSRSFLVIRSH